LVLKISQLFVGSKFRWKKFYVWNLFRVCWWWWRVSKFGIQLGFQILEKMG
jgi:hypothetical protein